MWGHCLCARGTARYRTRVQIHGSTGVQWHAWRAPCSRRLAERLLGKLNRFSLEQGLALAQAEHCVCCGPLCCPGSSSSSSSRKTMGVGALPLCESQPIAALARRFVAALKYKCTDRLQGSRPPGCQPPSGALTGACLNRQQHLCKMRADTLPACMTP